MAAAVTLEDAREKLRWARKHLDSIGPQIQAFEQRNDHRITVDIEPNEGKYTFHVLGLPVADPEWGLVIGDSLHNARTALDYLMVRLVCLVTGQLPIEVDAVQFPIYPKPERFDGAMGKVRDLPGFGGYLTRLKELQPFNVGDPSIWGRTTFGLPVLSALPAALERLSILDNIDKHRVVHATWQGGVGNPVVPNPPAPHGFKLLASTRSNAPLEEGAEIGSWRFETPLPTSWNPTQMDMNRCFPIEISLGEPLPFKAVMEVLPLCLWAVETILDLFEPVFAHGRPPLPVTSTLVPPWL